MRSTPWWQCDLTQACCVVLVEVVAARTGALEADGQVDAGVTADRVGRLTLIDVCNTKHPRHTRLHNIPTNITNVTNIPTFMNFPHGVR